MAIERDDAWTVGRLLGWTSEFLARKGAENARLDAEILLAHVLKCQRVGLYMRFGEAVREPERAAYRDLVGRRAAGEPVAYLVGQKEFYSLTFEVTRDVLIPRPATEFLVVALLDYLKNQLAPLVVDVGTGSGCIALACAHHHKTARFVAIDQSERALGVARRNAASLGLAERVRFVQGDLLEPVAEEGPFHAIVSNPPYIADTEFSSVVRDVREFEPAAALEGGPDGLRLIRRLIRDAIPLLAPGGALLIEIGSLQETSVRALIEAEPLLAKSETLRDHENHPRVARAIRRD